MTLETAVVAGETVPWAVYEQRPEDSRTEYVDGRLLVSPSPSRQHQKISTRLVFALEAVVPGTHDVSMAWAWKPHDDEFIPDVMVHPVTDETVRFTGLPALVVEILSGNRNDDLVLKSGKYAVAGLAHYWVLDPRDEVLDAFVLDGGLYRPESRVTLASGSRALDLGVATLDVDLSSLL